MQLGDGLRNLGTLDRLAAQDTAIHRRSPAIKVGVTLIHLAAIASMPPTTLAGLTPFVFYPVFLAGAGRIPLELIFRRVLWTLPFALLLGAFNPVLDRQPWMEVGPWVVSRGWVTYASLVLRFALTVSIATTLAATTGIRGICLGLRGLGAPHALATQVAMLHRYSFLLAEEGLRMLRAREMRANGRPLRLWEARNLLGHLLLRAWDRASRVHAAMLARGFDGLLKSHLELRITKEDVFFAVLWVGLAALFRIVNIPQLLGQLFGRLA